MTCAKVDYNTSQCTLNQQKSEHTTGSLLVESLPPVPRTWLRADTEIKLRCPRVHVLLNNGQSCFRSNLWTNTRT